ncbi:hypothetical protein [Collinsella tanakaei]|uniref:hypothetical protein n=1 Tax=Collinsella tanakaei TaxID=626935 RepID=UPI0025A3B71A|nr:hypothetical protein [Collinsella tanakaei]MDM8300569.1 hypothetical protein [Collinsella tanakaei]
MNIEANGRNTYPPANSLRRPIESASASTRDQANDSRFAFTLLAVAFGVLALIGISLGLLLYSVAVRTSQTSGILREDTALMRPYGGFVEMTDVSESRISTR